MAALILSPTQPSLFKRETPKIKLRPEQEAFKAQIWEQVFDKRERRVLGVAPCGFGKTVVAASMVKDLTDQGSKVLFLVHAKCLVEQTIESFAKYHIWAGAIAGGMKETRSKPVQVAMLQTLARNRNISWFRPDYVIADECHETLWSKWSLDKFPRLRDGVEVTSLLTFDQELAVLGLAAKHNPSFEEVRGAYKLMAEKHHPDKGGDKETMQAINGAYQTLREYRSLFNGDRNTAPILIGLTATPWRLSKKQSMGDLFKVQTLGPTPGDMVKLGAATDYTQGLVPFIYWSIPGAEMKTVRVPKDRDYTEAEMRQISEAFSVPDVVQCAVDNYKSKAAGRPFVCFPTTVHHAQLLHRAFDRSGIKTALITGDTPNNQRKRIYQEVRDSFLAGIISVGCIGIGFDLPEVSCVIDCCPTESLSQYVQKAGRGQRIAPWVNKKDCIYLDQAGNVTKKKFGRIEDITYGQLYDSIEIEPGESPVKECPNCGHITQTFNMTCPACGYEFPAKKKEVAVGDMVLLIRENEQDLFNAFQDLLRRAFLGNYKPLWAAHQVNQLYRKHPTIIKAAFQGGKSGTWYPKKEWYYRAIFKDPCAEDVQTYRRYLQAATAKDPQPKAEWWFTKFIESEFGKAWQSLPSRPQQVKPAQQQRIFPEDF